MRIVGSSLVVVALLLLSGGVSVRAEGDQTTAEVGQTSAAEVRETCEPVPRHVHVAPNPVAAALRDARSVIDLNTRGYNYVRDGEYRPRTPKTTSSAEPADGSVPAAPAEPE